MLDRGNFIYAYKEIGSGGLSGDVCDPRLIFQTAILAHASSIILSHSHPSGNTKPSAADISLTKRMVEPGRLLEIQVLDHLIITVDGCTSMADDGLM
ncbi:MAG: JAB domain-containing protein [Bacteroidetes bacterium]|nr:JAB domain-containing protein [Bacteroidota bacterium]MBP9790480.1 JAB domain-containing protein [Bacteroidia bacterium]